MKFYVDECLPPATADAISRKRGHRAIHAGRDLGFASRPDAFHIQESRRRREGLVTWNHREFKQEFLGLRHHPGMVVFDPGGTPSVELFSDFVDVMLEVFRTFRIGAKPPQRVDMWERRLVISGDVIYFENAAGERFDVLPRPEVLGWRPTPRRSSSKRT